MASTIKVDQIEGSAASTVTIPTGQTFTVTDGLTGTGSGITALNATEITSGTIPSVDRLPTVTVAKGGTNISSYSTGDVLYATGSTTLAKLSKPTTPAGEQLTFVESATAPSWVSKGVGYVGFKPLKSNIPLYAKSAASTTYGTDGKYPWLADYDNDWIPQDPFPNTECGPVKHARNWGSTYSASGGFTWLNENHEWCHVGESIKGPTGSQGIRGGTHINMAMSQEFGGMADGEYFVRIWMREDTFWALTNKGNLWVRGENGYSELGVSGTTDRWLWIKNPYLGPDATYDSLPATIAGFCVHHGGNSYQSAAYKKCYAIDVNGRLFSWGYNAYGELGINSTSTRATPFLNTTIPTTGQKVISVSAGARDTMFLQDDGAVYYAGGNTSGIGEGSSPNVPTAASTVSNVVQILCNSTNYSGTSYQATAYTVDTAGLIYSIGENSAGQLGIGNTTDQSSWQAAGGSIRFAVVHVSAGGTTQATAAIEGTPGAPNGDLYLCGYNGQGVCLQDNTTNKNQFVVPVTTIFGTKNSCTATSTDGTATTTEITFPIGDIEAIWPTNGGSYTYPAFFYLDSQGRLWYSGYHVDLNDFQNSIAAGSYDEAMLVPTPWSHVETSGKNYAGKNESTIAEMANYGNYYNAYHNHIILGSDGQMWWMGDDTDSTKGTYTSTNNTQFTALMPGDA